MTRLEASRIADKIAERLVTDSKGNKSNRLGIIDTAGEILFLSEAGLSTLITEMLAPPRRRMPVARRGRR